MENNYEQILKEYPQRLAKQIENADAFQQALVFINECITQKFPVKGLKISGVEIKITISQDSKETRNTNFTIHIPEEIYNS